MLCLQIISLIKKSCSGTVFDRTYTRAGVLRRSILSPLHFLLYIIDIVNDIGSDIRLFADNTIFSIIVDDLMTETGWINADVDKISASASTWFVPSFL